MVGCNMRPLLLALLSCTPRAPEAASISQPLISGPWQMHTIANLLETADGVDFADLDGDGYEDMVAAWIEDKSITAHYHPGANVGTTPHNWPATRLYRGAGQNEDVHLAHLDADGTLDYAWAERVPGRVYAYTSAWWTTALAQSHLDSWNRVTSFDADGDGDLDVIAGGQNRISYWAVRHNGSPGTWSHRQIAVARWVLSLWPEDVDADGDLDLWFTARHGGTGAQYGLYQAINPGGVTTPWPTTAIADRIPEGIGALIACRGDVDNDGDEDIVVPWEDGAVTYYERPSWTEHDILVGWPVGMGIVAKGCAVQDLDADNLSELIVTTWLHPTNNVWLQQGGSWVALDAPGLVLKTDEPFLRDIDGDGDSDIVLCEATAKAGVVWLENPL